MALVFFLLCSVVGTLILTGATANAGRLRNERAEQENYLAVSSAAVLLRDAFVAMTIEEYYDPADPEGEPFLIFPTEGLEGLAADIYNDSIAVGLSRVFTINAGDMPPVTAVLTRPSDTRITVELYIDTGGQRTNAMWFRLSKRVEGWSVTREISKGAAE